MPKNNREWLRTWVNADGRDLGHAERERALDIAELAFRGRTGVGDAARIGIDAVKKDRDREKGE